MISDSSHLLSLKCGRPIQENFMLASMGGHRRTFSHSSALSFTMSKMENPSHLFSISLNEYSLSFYYIVPISFLG
jgi:hypothetical protein